MKRAEVEIGKVYAATVSGKLARVKILRDRGTPTLLKLYEAARHRGWDALNLDTQRTIHVRTAARLRPIESQIEGWFRVIREMKPRSIQRRDDAETHAG